MKTPDKKSDNCLITSSRLLQLKYPPPFIKIPPSHLVRIYIHNRGRFQVPCSYSGESCGHCCQLPFLASSCQLPLSCQMALTIKKSETSTVRHTKIIKGTHATIETSGRILGNFDDYKDFFNHVRNSTRSLRPLSHLRVRNVIKSHLTTTQHPMNLKRGEDN